MCDTVFHKYQQLQDHLVTHYPDTKKVGTPPPPLRTESPPPDYWPPPMCDTVFHKYQ